MDLWVKGKRKALQQDAVALIRKNSSLFNMLPKPAKLGEGCEEGD
jgi:hypothetical protein